MTEIARLPFHSSRVPEERGALVLRDDGTFQVEPSEAFRDALAEREALALDRAETYGTRLGLGLLALGALAVVAGWYLGRAFGSAARNLSGARAVGEVRLTRDAAGNLRLRMPGGEHRWQRVTQDWPAGDFDAADAERFIQTLKEMRG